VIAFAEERSNLAAQWCYEINKTNSKWWKEQKEQLRTAGRMTLCGRTVMKNGQMMTLVTDGLVTDGR
jgi:hypothetical protein